MIVFIDFILLIFSRKERFSPGKASLSIMPIHAQCVCWIIEKFVSFFSNATFYRGHVTKIKDNTFQKQIL